MSKTRLLFAACAIALIASPVRAHETHTVEEFYVGGSPAIGVCRQDSNEDVNAATVCFDIDPTEDFFVSLSAVDLVSPKVGFFWFIHDASGNCADGSVELCRSSGYACGSTAPIFIPGNASRIRVAILDPALGSVGCAFIAGGSMFGAATAGTMTATFYD